MKNNAMLKIAAILLVAVLLTTCAISSTFAKYVTKGTAGTAEARVAKWGITATTTIDGLFATSYTNSDKTATSLNTESIMAPGTSDSGTISTVVDDSKAEVSYAVSYDAVVEITGFALANGDEYCPITFTVGTATYSTADGKGTNKSTDIADLEADVAKAIEDAGADADVTVGWAWAFQVDDAAADPTDGYANDVKDTYIAGNGTNKVKLTITPTVEQTGPAVAGN